MAKPNSLAVLLCGLMFCSCAARPPDESKVVAATNKVKESQEQARTAHKEERAKIKDVQAVADDLSVVSADLLGKVDSLAKILPAEFQPPLADIRKDAVESQAKEDFLITGLVDVWHKDTEVEQHLATTDIFVTHLEVEQAIYHKEAVKQTDKLNAAEKKLWWYRLHWWGAWIALGSAIVAGIAWVVIKWGAKWSAKLGKYAL